MMLVRFFSIFVLVMIGLEFSSCSAEESEGAVWAPFILWFPISLLFASVQAYHEVQVVRLSTIPFVQEVGRFKIGMCPVPFTIWAIWGLVLSLINFLGFASFTVVTAKWIRESW